MTVQGYIKLHRQLIEWEWYSDINVCRVFLHCLLLANFQDKKWQGITIKRGSFITSYEKLAIDTRLTIMQVRTALNKLKLTNEITYNSTSQYSIITINNYDKYQDDNKQNNKPITNKQQTNNKQITTTNNDKNDKNEKNVIYLEKKPSKEEIQNYLSILGKKINVDEFINYWSASDWKDKSGLPINWKQKLVTWSLNDKKRGADMDIVEQLLKGEYNG